MTRTILLKTKLNDLEAAFLHQAGITIIENKRIYFKTQLQLKLVAAIYKDIDNKKEDEKNDKTLCIAA